MPSLTFYLRSSRRGSGTRGRLCLRIVHRRESKTHSSPYLLYDSEFLVLLSGVDIPAHLKEVHVYMESVRDTFSRLIRHGGCHHSASGLMCHFRYSGTSLSAYGLRLSSSLFSCGQVRTARAYRSSLRRLSLFLGKDSIPFSAISSSVMESFERRLQDDCLSPNTISFYMRNLRSLYRKAVDDGLVEACRVNPFRHVFTGFHNTRKRALDASQMQRLQNLDYSRLLEEGSSPGSAYKESLYTSWRLFTFSFHARGLCFVDLSYLRKEDIRGGVLRYYRKKTGVRIEVKITPVLQRIIDSFSCSVKDSVYLFPIITRDDKDARLQYENGLYVQNRRLKKLGQEAGLSVSLSTHVSRHSWASIAKSRNTPLWVISEGLGHSNEKVTYTYLSRLDRSRLDLANDAVCALVSRGSSGPGSASGLFNRQ